MSSAMNHPSDEADNVWGGINHGMRGLRCIHILVAALDVDIVTETRNDREAHTQHSDDTETITIGQPRSGEDAQRAEAASIAD